MCNCGSRQNSTVMALTRAPVVAKGDEVIVEWIVQPDGLMAYHTPNGGRYMVYKKNTTVAVNSVDLPYLLDQGWIRIFV